ncbi:luciferase-like domain-containing protein [Xylogone sp. PMI_703]|nr:luciferase-like domain-containing protein [Xylogone sp. PMI_703]
MTSDSGAAGADAQTKPKKRIIMQAFVMGCGGHMSIGQWRHPEDHSSDVTHLEHWTEIAKLLDRGQFDALFLADVLGGYDAYGGNMDSAVKTGTQFPVVEPTLLVPAMAAVTKNLCFGVTVSTTYEHPFQLARRFSTLDHLTKGRVAWNVVTSYLESAAKNMGLDTQVPHDTRYEIAYEYMDVVYALWESSWHPDALVYDKATSTVTRSELVRKINHKGKHFSVAGPHLVAPSPQRTPLIFQAGSSGVGLQFAAKHGEAVFVSGHAPDIIRPRVDTIRRTAKEQYGRDPNEIKVIVKVTTIIAETDELAQAKYLEHKKYEDHDGALTLMGGSGLDLKPYPRDQDLSDTPLAKKLVDSYRWKHLDAKKWTTGMLAEFGSIGGNGPLLIGSPSTVADQLEVWLDEADVDGFNFAYVVWPGTYEDIVNLLVPELRKRGRIPEPSDAEPVTMREKFVGRKHVGNNHAAEKFKWV